MISPALMNFLGGLFAAAGINLLTSMVTNEANPPDYWLFILAVPWLCLTAGFAYIANEHEGIQRRADLLVTRDLSPEERESILAREKRHRSHALRKAWVVVSLIMFVNVFLSLWYLFKTGAEV